ncbi:hypothetical protein ACLKA7_002777 [Drosophila subpalustris]
MQLTKGTFLLLTLCLSCGGSWAKPRLDLIQDIWEGLGDATHDILDGLAEATKDGGELTADLLEHTLANTLDIAIQIASAVSDELTANLKELADSLTSNIAALEDVLSAETDRIKKNALKNGLSALELLSKNLEKLQKELAAIDKRFDDTIEDQISQALTELQTWGEQQLQRVDEATAGAGVPRANKLINNVINRYEKDLNRTLNELILVQTLFKSDVNDAIEDYTEYARFLIDQMNNCAEQSSNRCKDNVALLSSKVRTSTSRLNQLVRSGNQLVAAGVKATKNFENLEPRLERDQAKCESDLDRIIKLNPTTTTAATTISTTAEPEETTAEPEKSTDGSTAEPEETTADQDGTTTAN